MDVVLSPLLASSLPSISFSSGHSPTETTVGNDRMPTGVEKDKIKFFILEWTVYNLSCNFGPRCRLHHAMSSETIMTLSIVFRMESACR